MDLGRGNTFLLALAALVIAGTTPSSWAQKYITVASTTSTEQSGLFKHMLPAFQKKTGIEVKVVAVGSGEAFDMARRGNADVVFTHARTAEEKFIDMGLGVKRFPVMYNDFVLVGPKSDPAKLAGSKDILAALRKIRAAANVPFVSRGDRSGTHIAELGLWEAAGIDIAREKGGWYGWYRGAGQSMGDAIIAASSMYGYVLADRGTWIAFKNRTNLTILVEGDKRLFNQYAVILVNPARYPQVKKELGQAFIDWVVSPEGQKNIADHKIGGEQLFFPNANDKGA